MCPCAHETFPALKRGKSVMTALIDAHNFKETTAPPLSQVWSQLLTTARWGGINWHVAYRLMFFEKPLISRQQSQNSILKIKIFCNLWFRIFYLCSFYS